MPQQAKATPIDQPPTRGSAGSAPAQPSFGVRNKHKPTKTIIGIALLLVLSFLLYEINGKSKVEQPAPAATSDRAAPSR
jgi:hypothetical protein